MRIFITISVLFMAVASAAQTPGQLNKTYVDITKGAGTFNVPAMIYLPTDYASSPTKRYPVIFSYHGAGQQGTDTAALDDDGLLSKIAAGQKPQAVFNGSSREFIVVAAQRSSYSPDPSWFPGMFENITSRFRVDSSRFYLYGMSAGGWSTTGIFAIKSDTTYVRFITAIQEHSGAKNQLDANGDYGTSGWANLYRIANRGIPWASVSGGQVSDASYNAWALRVHDTLNNYYAGSAVHTEASHGHDNFAARCDSAYRPSTLGSKNIYEWFAQYKNDFATGWEPSGGALSANAGADIETFMPANSITLSGAASTGTITSVTWSKIESPTDPNTNGTITSASSITSTVTNLSVGQYKFRLVVGDGVTTDDDTVTVLVHKQKSPDCSVGAPATFNLVPSGSVINYSDYSSFTGLKGGDTLVIPGSTDPLNPTIYQQIWLDNLLAGDSCRKVEVKPGGYIEVGTSTSVTSKFRFVNGRYIHFDGQNKVRITGARNGGNNIAISIGGYSSDIKIERVNIDSVDNAVFCKKDYEAGNSLSYYPNWNYKNMDFGFITVNRTIGEAWYVGNTGTGLPGNGTRAVYHDNLKIHDCHITDAGWDGIQVSWAKDFLIYNDTVLGAGWSGVSAQENGFVLGGYSNGQMYNCYVRKSASSGVAVFGGDTVSVTNCRFDSCGFTSVDGPQPAIYANDNRFADIGAPSPTLVLKFENNCIRYASTYASGAVIRNADLNNTSRAGYIRNNSVYDQLGRNFSATIISQAGDTITGNVATDCSIVIKLNARKKGKKIKIIH